MIKVDYLNKFSKLLTCIKTKRKTYKVLDSSW